MRAGPTRESGEARIQSRIKRRAISGIAPNNAPAFIVSQVCGALIGLMLAKWLQLGSTAIPPVEGATTGPTGSARGTMGASSSPADSGLEGAEPRVRLLDAS